MRKTLCILALASVAALSPVALRASGITYTVDEAVGIGSVIGTITTDGTIGTLATTNVLDWNLLLNDGLGTATLNIGNSGLSGDSTDLSATPTLLQFNFNGGGNYMNFYSVSLLNCTEWSFQTGAYEGCNGTVAGHQGIS